MSTITKTFVIGLFMGALTVSAAQAGEGLYAGVAVGFAKAVDTTASGASGGKVKFDNGPVGAVFVGHDYGSNVRAEVELARRAADLKSVAGTTASGEALATSLMINVIYDVDVDLPITPYVGIGLGLAQIKMDGASPFGGSSINDSDTVGAFQAIAGVRYALTDQVDVFGDYRYFKTADAGLVTRGGVATSMDFSTHSGLLGLRYSFGGSSASPVISNGEDRGAIQADMNAAVVAEPVQMAAAEPDVKETPTQAVPQPITPVRTLPDAYVVFFLLNKAALTPEGLTIIQQVAENAKTMKLTRLHLTGHTDHSGAEKYNLALSMRRAEAVQAAFVAAGFQASDISIKAKGEAEPDVDVSGKEYEPKNRRVEIVLP
ncbi:MAG: hypothetical protein COB46_07300 [Rhodospirillaceae bacterium]|nr:MAG: hypothetical protein COB46_07300 [Rhodospirillaceae bacterium]